MELWVGWEGDEGWGEETMWKDEIGVVEGLFM